MSDSWLELYKKIRVFSLKKTILPTAVFIVLLIITYIFWTKILDQVMYERRAAFDTEVNRVVGEITNRVNVSNSILIGVKGYYESMPHTISPEEWSAYTQGQTASLVTSCIDELGYIKKINKDQIKTELKTAGDYSSTVFKKQTDVVLHPDVNKDEYYIIKYITPLTESSSVLEGYDYSSQPQLLQDLQKAGSSGRAVATPIQKMWNSDHSRVDTIMPIYYKSSTIPTSQGQLRGFVLAISDIDKCEAGIILSSFGQYIDYEVYDITDNPSANPFFDSNPNNQIIPQFVYQKSFYFQGRQWLIKFKALPQFGVKTSDVIFLIVYPIAAILTSFLVSLIIFIFLTSRSRALRLADKVTKELQDSEAKLKSIFEQAPDAMFVIDDDGRFVDANSAGIAMHGLSKKELILHHTVFDFISPDEKNVDRKVWDRFLVEGKMRFDFMFKGPISGQNRYMEVTATAHYLPGLNLVIIRDVTHHRQIEAALKQSNEVNSAILNATVEAVYLIDLDGRIITANESGAARFNMKPGELSGKIIYEYFPPELAKVRRDRASAVIDSGEPTKYEDFRSGRYFRNSIYPIHDSSGKVYQLAIFSEDMTDRKLTEITMARTSRALRVLSESNQAMVRIKNEDEFVKKVCDIVVNVGGYRLAWIGTAINDVQKTVKPIAQVGYEDGYLSSVKISWGDNEYGQGPTGIAIRYGKVSVMKDILNDPSYVLWREAASKRGYASSAAFPIPLASGIFGALNIYSSEPDAFSESEIKLLTELANDIGFGIGSIRTQISLIESEEIYTQMTNNLGLAVVVYKTEDDGKSFILKDFSSVAEKIEGVKKQDVIGKDVTRAFPGAVQMGIVDVFKHVYKTGNSQYFPEKKYSNNGKDSWRRNFIYKTPDGNIVAIYADVTNEVISRENLKKSEENYRLLVDLSPDAIAVHSGKSVLFVNMAAVRLFGAKSAENLIGRPTMSFVHPDSQKVVEQRISEMIETGKSVSLNAEKFLKIDGTPIDVEVIAAPVVFEGVKAIQVIVHDISEIKRSEEHLKQVNADMEKFKLAVQNASDHIIITDADAKILYANNAASRITGYPINEMIGANPRLWGGQMPADFYKTMWKTIKEEKKSFTGEVTNRRKSGESYQAVMSIAPILDEKGNIIFFVGIERDVTKERAIDKSKSEFVSLASHQLRTPLSAINWYTEMLLDEDVGKLNKKQKDYLGEIYHSSKRMADLVGSLLNVSRIELGTFAIEPKPTDIIEILKSVIKELSHEIKKRHQKLTEQYDKTIGLLSIDQSLMRVVLQNLISNSVKYTPNKGSIKVEVHKIGNDIIISVSDSGYGIPERQQSRIFEKFFRADNIREVETDGTGLGLYIVKEIVEKSGGSIWFESKENKGTKFYVSLPVKGMIQKSGTKKLI